MFVFNSYTSDVAIGSDEGLLRWALNAQLLNAISAGSPAAQGEGVARWQADAGDYFLDQATSAKRPLADYTVFPGRNGLTFSADDNLTVTPTATQGAFLVIVGAQSGTRTLVSRDTSQTTTAPAFSIAVEEGF